MTNRNLRRRRVARSGIESLEVRLLLSSFPTADAGDARSMALGQTITLHGAGSAADGHRIVSLSWDLDHNGEYGDAAGEQAHFLAVAPGTFTIGLQVTDEAGATASDTTTVTVYSTGTETAFAGYNLFAALDSTIVNLTDNDGNVVHSWATNYRPGTSMYLLPNGQLLRSGNVNNTTFTQGGQGGIVQLIDWDGTVAWEYEYAGSQYLQHHDIEMLPNGNILMITWQRKARAEAIAAGRNPSLLSGNELWPDSILEIQPSGRSGASIVWEWHAWDHLVQDFDPSRANYGVVADHPELIDVNYTKNNVADWLHSNSIDYNAELDQILLSVHGFSEIWIIDHSTTTAEAASHIGGSSGKGGDLLYRWGNPAAWHAGTAADEHLFGQHTPEWIEDGLPGSGNILLFNNGFGRPNINYSSVEEIVTPVTSDGSYTLLSGSPYGPIAPLWDYTADPPTDFFARFVSGAQRLPNGNTLINNGPASYFFEVTPSGKKVWEYDFETTAAVFRILRYAPEYAGFDGTPLDDVSTNKSPKADAGGPYSGVKGDTIRLSAARSADSDGTIVSYTWDLNGDGQYDDATGEAVSFNATTVGTFSVCVQVTDNQGGTHSESATVTVVDHLSKPKIQSLPRFPANSTPAVTWSEVTGASAYQVWLTRMFPALARVLKSESTVNATAFTPSDRLDPGYYKVWVQAVDSHGHGGPWSEATTFEIRPDAGLPAIATFDGLPTFTWPAIPNAPGYQLYIRTDDGVSTVIDNIPSTSFTLMHQLSRPNGRWWIRSSDATGNLGWSLPGTFGPRTQILTPGGPPQASSPVFEWIPVAGAGRYVLQVTNVETNSVVIREDNLNEARYTPITALPQGRYRVWVKAIDRASDTTGWWSSGVDFAVNGLSSPRIQPLARYPEMDAPTISWNPVVGASGYQVWLARIFPEHSRVFASQSNVSGPSFTPPRNLNPGYYKVWIQAVDTSGAGGPWSVAAGFEIRPELGTPDIASIAWPPTFTWPAIPDAPGYQLYLRTDDGVTTIINDIPTTHWTPDAAFSRKSGRWWIRSSDAISNFGWSLPGTFNPRTKILTPGGASGNDLPTFTWIPVTGAGRYILQVTNPDSNVVVIREDELTATSFQASTPLPAGNYRAWVKAIDGVTDLFSSGLWSLGASFSITAAS